MLRGKIVPWLGLGLGLVLGVGEQFSTGAIVLEPCFKHFKERKYYYSRTLANENVKQKWQM